MGMMYSSQKGASHASERRKVYVVQ
ncbi:uncharacterized protein G2W53_017966 [Senna tora]|uniref:Uncharacterized protein n=1 Tax=Senna tora TaxID=362788 RepID=A0A834TRU8_9FABA|nr:uncharacterized protein G2W53_017966 [Senna tora]